MPTDHLKSIEDGYEDYLDDEAGYAFDAWDRLSGQEIRHHDAILHGTAADASGAHANDLLRWARARAMLKQDRLDVFYALCRELSDSSEAHPALFYDEIVACWVEVAAHRQHLDQAREALQRFRTRWPERTRQIVHLEIVTSLAAGALEHAQTLFAGAVGQADDDAEFAYELAEDAARRGHVELAHAWLAHTETLARKHGDRALEVDIALLREALLATSGDERGQA